MACSFVAGGELQKRRQLLRVGPRSGDRKSTRLNSSHVRISYAGFCLKKNKFTEALGPRPCPYTDDFTATSTSHPLSLDPLSSFFFFFNDTATTEIYTLSLHDALPIS